MQTTLPELLMPAGNLSKLQTALAYGADAVYVGARGLSMRPDEASFDIDELAEAVSITRDAGKRIYAGINTLMFGEDLQALERWIAGTKDIDLDAVIVSDPGAFERIRQSRPELSVHISTQLSTSNAAAAKFWKTAGASRIVLARECSLAQAREIAESGEIDVEIFVHGAMCMAVSGRCLLSAYLCGHSGSKGECKHSCRWEWQLVEAKRPGETVPVFETGRETIFLGSTDLCLVEHIPAVVRSGVSSLKVEGRMKSELYVATVAGVYRAALDRYAQDPGTWECDPSWLDELQAVSHRPYATGFAFGSPSDPETIQTHNRPVSTCEILAVLRNRRDDMLQLAVRNPFSIGEQIEWIGPGNSGGTVSITRMQNIEGEPIDTSHCGTDVYAVSDVDLPDNSILRRRK